MRKNVTLAVITGVVIAAAVAGMGWLMLRGEPAPRRTADTPVARVEPNGRKAALPPPRKVESPKVAPKKEPAVEKPKAGGVDICKLVDDLLREYDTVIVDGGQLNVPEVDRIYSLRERAARIDKIVEKLATLGIEAIPCLMDALRADARSNRVDRQTVVVRALAKIPGCKEPIDALAEALTASDAWGVKMTVVAQLAESPCPEGMNLLCQRVEIEQDFRIRGAILKFIGQKKTQCGSQV